MDNTDNTDKNLSSSSSSSSQQIQNNAVNVNPLNNRRIEPKGKPCNCTRKKNVIK